MNTVVSSERFFARRPLFSPCCFELAAGLDDASIDVVVRVVIDNLASFANRHYVDDMVDSVGQINKTVIRNSVHKVDKAKPPNGMSVLMHTLPLFYIQVVFAATVGVRSQLLQKLWIALSLFKERDNTRCRDGVKKTNFFQIKADTSVESNSYHYIVSAILINRLRFLLINLQACGDSRLV